MSADLKSSDSPAVRITKNFNIPSDVLNLISRQSAEHYKMLPLKKEDKKLYIGITDIKNLEAVDALDFITRNIGLEYEMQAITEEQFTNLLNQYEDPGANLEEMLGQLEEEHDMVFGSDEEDSEASVNPETLAPIVKIVRNKILGDAVEKVASDIHIEPRKGQSVVRFRIDGELGESFRFNKPLHEQVVLYIKNRAKMKTDESRKPDDGRFGGMYGRNPRRKIDFRVATFPTAHGEKVIIRILDSSKGIVPLSDLGFTPDAEKKIRSATKYPHGLILVTGPTGSGKTTALYSLLDTIDRETINVVSLEDPVEYQVDGISQSSIRPEIGYSFASGLRSVLRGDPDQILVGEIRDKETADLAVEAALTGHLVYSTLHTNTAIGAVTRLLDLGVEKFLLAPTIRIVIGAKLAPRIDGEKKERPITDELRESIEERISDLPDTYRNLFPPFTSFFDPVPTEDNPKGLKGRIGIYEVLEVDDDMQSVVMTNPTEDAMFELARKKGYITMAEDAIIKGLKGIIPYSEVIRVDSDIVVDLTDEEEDSAPSSSL